MPRDRLRRDLGRLVRRAGGDGGCHSVSGERAAREECAARADAGGRRALSAVRRSQPAQCPESGPDRCAGDGADTPMDLGCRFTGAIGIGIRSCRTRCGKWRPTAFAGRWRSVTSAYSSYSGCRQYLENIEQRGRKSARPRRSVDKLRAFFNHPGFIEADDRAHARGGRARFRPNGAMQRGSCSRPIAFRLAMARGCAYESQLREACRLVAAGIGLESLAIGLSKPQRAAEPALARAGYPRLASRGEGGRGERRRHRADRIRLGSRRGDLRSRYRSPRRVRELGNQHGAGRQRSARIRDSSA